MDKKLLLTKFLVEKDYKHVIELTMNSSNPYELNLLAKTYLELREYQKASDIFKSIRSDYEYGRCQLLMGNMDTTVEIWNSIKEDSPPLLWGKSLLEFINLYVVNVPSFFQIRAFLEMDLDALLKAQLINYCENIANGAHIFARNNQESYKFIGRVFVNNNYYDLAKLYLHEAKKLCYIDPETHYLLAKCHIYEGDYEKAKNALKTSIEKGYGYYPAKKLLEKIIMA